MDIIADRLDALICTKCGHHMPLAGIEPFTDITCPECDTTQPVPLRFGNFYLLKELGKGGMGAVYKALDQTLGRYVAIKVMRKEMGDDSKALQDFLREARAAAALNHRNVVQIYSCGQEKGQPYIVMEMVGGGRLDQQVDAGERLEEARLLEIARDVALGLEAANQVGLIHGDIKPANILFGYDGTAKVVDFGLARFVASQQAPGEIWGTPFYVAPEKARRAPEDLRSDIYSLGATLFHALAGRPPFDGDTAADVVLARIDHAAPDVRDIRHEVHPETSALLARMLEEDPARRYPTYRSLLPDLDRAIRAVKAGPATPDQRPSRVGKLVGLAAAVLLIGSVIGGVLYWKNRDAAKPELDRQPIKFRFVNGQLVPVYADEEPDEDETATPAPSGVEGAEAATEAQPALAARPFSAEEDKAFADLLSGVTAGPANNAQPGLDAFHDGLAQTHAGRYWVRLAQAMIAWAHADEASFTKYADELRAAEVPGEDHAAALSQVLLLFMVGEIAERVMEDKAAAGPAWLGAWVHLATGLKALHQGRPDEATAPLTAYLNQESPEDLAWPYALEPLAESLRDQAEKWVKLTEAADEMSKRGEHEAALREIEKFRGQAPPVMLPLADSLAASVQAAAVQKAKADAKAAAIELEEHREEVQQDLDQVDAARAEILEMIPRLDFAEARKRIHATRPSLKSDEGRAWLSVVEDGYKRMDELKAFLTRAVHEKPFGHELGGEFPGSVVGASDDGLIVKLGGESHTVKPWSQIGPRIFARMASRYISTEDMSRKERARRSADAALFCFESGMGQPAARFAHQAIEGDPELSDSLEMAMPGLLGN